MAYTGQISILFDLKVCRLDAIKKAAYRLGSRLSIEVRSVGENSAEVLIDRREGMPDEDEVFKIVKREVLDQELRELVSAETQDIRNLLLAHAFSQVTLPLETEAPKST